jgi:hypothetical protein
VPFASRAAHLHEAKPRFVCLCGLRQSFGKIAGSTGTGGFLLDHDHVIVEKFAALRFPALRVANNDNSKNKNALKIVQLQTSEALHRNCST